MELNPVIKSASKLGNFRRLLGTLWLRQELCCDAKCLEICIAKLALQDLQIDVLLEVISLTILFVISLSLYRNLLRIPPPILID